MDFCRDFLGWGGEGEGRECVELRVGVGVIVRLALGVEVVVDLAGGLRGSGRGQEVEPGVGEGDDGASDVMGFHEGEFGGEGGVGFVDGAAAGVEGFRGVIVGGEDDEARW